MTRPGAIQHACPSITAAQEEVMPDVPRERPDLDPAVPCGPPKMLREALCLAQSALEQWARDGRDVDRVPGYVADLGQLVRAIDKHRPVGTNGKHADLHTYTCGCDGHERRWSIELRPREAAPHA